MRALPLIERVLLAIIVVVMLVVLAFLFVWHLRWLTLQGILAGNRPRPGVVLAPPRGRG